MKRTGQSPSNNYVVKITGRGYFSAKAPWSSVPIEKADRMTHKVARRVRDQLKRPGIELKSSVERIEETNREFVLTTDQD